MYRCIAHGRYSPNELRYLPLNTALYEPPLDPELPALDSEPDSDDAEDGKEDKKNKNSSVRHSGFSISSYTPPHPASPSWTQHSNTLSAWHSLLWLVLPYRTVLPAMRRMWRPRRAELHKATSPREKTGRPCRAKTAAIGILPPTKPPQGTR